MREPSVCAILLTANRPEMARQAVENFRRQTYDPIRRTLLIFDSGSGSWYDPRTDSENEFHIDATGLSGSTVGELRNYANAGVGNRCEIILHWDSDDYSHPNRIAEQVALLQSSGAECVGYNQMLFWRETPQAIKDQYAEVQRRYPTDPSIPIPEHLRLRAGEAWLYSNRNPSYALGTSLCYWRHVWERTPFEATSVGEDVRFTSGIKCLGVRSVGPYRLHMGNDQDSEARMIARIHSGNTSDAYRPEAMARASEWKRVPESDSYCRSVFEK